MVRPDDDPDGALVVTRGWLLGLGLGGLGGLAALLLGGSAEASAPPPDDEPSDCPALPDRGELGGLVVRTYAPAEHGAKPVILLHGRGASEDAMFHALADVRLPAVQVYPRGPIALGSGFAWLAERSVDPGWSEAMAGALLRLRPLLKVVGHCWGPPVVAGHSQGAHLALAAAAVYPELVAGAVTASGALAPTLRSRFEVPVVAIHGRDDGTVRFSSLAELGQLGAQTVAIDGHGHAFSGPLRERFAAELEAMLG